MMVSTKGRYALRVMIDLAEHDAQLGDQQRREECEEDEEGGRYRPGADLRGRDAHGGIRSWMAHGWRPTSASTQPACEAR